MFSSDVWFSLWFVVVRAICVTWKAADYPCFTHFRFFCSSKMRSVKEEREEEEQDTDERDEGVVEEIQDETVAYYQ